MFGRSDSARDADLCLNAIGAGTIGDVADELDANSQLMMARHASGHLADQHVLADRWANVGLERDTAGREIEHLAADELAVRARVTREALGGRAIVTSQCHTID